jgi:hypothetical protein
MVHLRSAWELLSPLITAATFTSPTASQCPHERVAQGAQKKTKEVFDDYTQVPPPGWKPPKAERDALRAARGPSTMSQVARAARQAAKIITTPPFQPPTPPQQRRDTGARPKHPK